MTGILLGFAGGLLAAASCDSLLPRWARRLRRNHQALAARREAERPAALCRSLTRVPSRW